MRWRLFLFVLSMAFVISLSGCATIEKANRADRLEREVQRLQRRITELEGQKSVEIEEIKKSSLSDLEKAKLELEERLKKEIGEYKAKLEMNEKGLVITFLNEIFFDSGKDEIRPEGEGVLQKVSQVLNTRVAESPIAIEGHTDNQPIKYSGWKSNWELSSARALAVVHYFIDKCSIAPKRLSAVGYGEYRPIKSNDTVGGRRQNRRVEIVILPSLRKVKN